MITSLIGRKVKIQYAAGDTGTIVAVYLDQGELWLAVENPEGGIYTMHATAAHLGPREEPHLG